MKRRAKRILKIAAGLIVTFVGAVIVLFLWMARTPTTQLVDASGAELSAGAAGEGEEELFGGAVFADAKALIERREFAAARECLLKVLEASERDGETCILLSDVARELKEPDAAVDYGLKATKLLPESAEAHFAYAKALSLRMFSNMQGVAGMLGAMAQVGHFKTALDRVIELDPDDVEARTMLVFYNMAPKPIGDIETAIEISREVEARDPVRGTQLLAACYHRKGETPRAIALLRAGIDEHPGQSGLHVTLADIYADKESFAEADAEYEAARSGQKNTDYYRSLYGQARMRIVNEFEPARAVELLDEFIADEPVGENLQSVAHACWRKGNALEQLGTPQDARDAYEQSLLRDPGLKLAEKALESLRK